MKRAQTLTIFRQSRRASTHVQDEGLRVNGEEVHNITLLGKVIEATDTATNQVYTLDDGTGTVVVKQWVDADDADAASKKDAVTVGKYARVYGHVKQFGSDTSVVAFSVRPVEDHNEVTYHFLEAVYCNSHNASRADAKPAAPGAGDAAGAPAAVGLGNSWLRGANNPHDFMFWKIRRWRTCGVGRECCA